MGRYVLKFISGKFQGGEFALDMNDELIIGRSSELKMVLIEDMVSRHHAKITTTDSEVFIEDLGSTNGTFVNGERITRAKLKDGDRILVGTSIIKLVYQEGDSSRPPLPVLTPPDVTTPGISSRTRSVNRTPSNTLSAQQSGVLSGVIDQVPLPDLLQLFGPSKKSGCLFITTPSGTEGRIYLTEGRVYGAVINDRLDVPMDKSFYRMMGWTSGSFLLDTSAKMEFENPMDESVESLMMEGMRILDEIRAIGDDVPAYDDNMGIIAPLEAKLRDLTPEQLDMFQLVINYSSIAEILNHSETDDIETMQTLVNLIRNHYIAKM